MAERDYQPHRIRVVFGLSEKAALPRVDRESLHRYHQYLAAHLAMPFEAIYAETRPPVRHLIRYVHVTALLGVHDRISDGLMCQIDNLPHLHELALIEIGVREDEANHQLLDDYAYWFFNCR